MRTSINKITFFIVLVLFATHARSIDTTKEEGTCSYIGFKKGTESFGNCVLELLERNSKKPAKEAKVVAETNKQAKSKSEPQIHGDGTEDDSVCQKYGFKVGSADYGQCRQRIDLARQESKQKEAAYNEQVRQYEQQVAAQEKERDRQRRQKQLDISLRLLNGQSPTDAVLSAGTGAPITRPQPPAQTTFMLPGGKMLNCQTVGNVTNCF